jgi:hypothetical protein
MSDPDIDYGPALRALATSYTETAARADEAAARAERRDGMDTESALDAIRSAARHRGRAAALRAVARELRALTR